MHNERLLQTVGLTSSGLKGSHRSKTMGVGAINLNFPFKLCFILLKNQWHIFGIYRYCLDFKVVGFNFQMDGPDVAFFTSVLSWVLKYGILNVCLFNGMGLIWLIKFTSNQLKQAINNQFKIN